MKNESYKNFHEYIKSLNAIYKNNPALYERDYEEGLSIEISAYEGKMFEISNLTE